MAKGKEVKTANVVHEFEVSPVFPIELGADRMFDRKRCKKSFWRGDASQYKEEIGCYVFSIRTPKGYIPYYVGKTVRSFKDEIFQPVKFSDHYQQSVRHYKKGTPCMTFVVLKKKRGKVPEALIEELETYLIRVAYSRNSDLSNIKGIPRVKWEIKGIDSPRQGAPRTEVADFKKMMGLGKK